MRPYWNNDRVVLGTIIAMCLLVSYYVAVLN